MPVLNSTNDTGHRFMPSIKKLFSILSLGTLLLTSMVASGQDISPLPIAAAKLIEVNIPDSTPMTAAAIDLAKVGYTEREFYAEGKANRYRGVLPGAQATGQIIDGDWPYRTRVLVRTPKADKFNGTLVVEWVNVTSGQDIDFAFAESYNYLLREGYAVAVVSAQRLGVDRLKTWNPKRYGDLNVTASNSDPQTGQKIDDCPPGTACPGDPLSWDIMTQVSKALKDNAAPTKPLFDLKVRKVIALGESQSAMRLSLYYNTIQPLYKIFDGFVFLDLAQQMRADVNTPAISVNSESLAGYLPPPTTSEYTRIWEVAGASHMSFYAAHYVDNLLLREQSVPSSKGFLNFTQMMEQQGCKLSPLFSKVDNGLVLSAAIESVHQWVESGKPAAPTLQFQRDAKMQVMRDADGKVLGGVRLAQFSVPTAYMAPNGEALGCVLAGHHRDFTKDELKARYGNHQTYVSQVKAALEEVRKNGYILPFDEDAAILAAEKSDVAQ